MPDILGILLKLEMGNRTSKRKNENAPKMPQRRDSSDSGDDDYFDQIYREWEDDAELRMMRRHIERDPEVFILNNLMMSGQFFENFEEEMSRIRETPVSVREAEMNSLLHSQKHALMPDVLQEQVANKVDFIYERPGQIFSIEPLQPIRIYIVFNNIEVTEENFPSPYCTVDETVTYSMQLKQSKHKGYALLQCLEVNPSRRKTAPPEEPADSDVESLYYTNSSASKRSDKSSPGNPFKSPASESSEAYSSRDLYDSQTSKKPASHQSLQNLSKIQQTPSSGSPAESTSSGYRSGHYTIDSDSDTGYGGLYPKSSRSTSEIPKTCFIYTTNDQIYGTRKEKRQKLNQKDRVIRGVIHSRIYEVWYLNSRKFMDHFYEHFTNDLADTMGFDSKIQDEPQGAIIYRDKLELFESTTCLRDEQFAITPCVWSTWPEMAHEWLERPRADWPEYEMIEKIKESGCHLIPEGYSSERSNNDFQSLEWQVVFPAAERFLETCMSHPQVRVYVMALILQKTFFRPIESVVGLGGAHIRNQLFWLIEEDDRPVRWLESRSGENLLKLLNCLYKAISQDEPVLPDYFLREKNLFQGKIYLLRTQKQLKRIIENPVMYVLHALQNIRHSKRFFPVMDSAKLLRILTEDVLMIINPRIAGNGVGLGVDGEPEYGPGYGLWDSERKKKERRKVYGTRPGVRKSLIDAKQSADQVVEIEVRCAELDQRRLDLVLNFFILHFIEVAECYHDYRAQPQKTMFVEHAERLSVLLSENSNHRGAARTYLDKLKALKRRVMSSKPQNEPPATPQRNSDRPISTALLKDCYESQSISADSQQILRTPTPARSFDHKNGESTSACKLDPAPGGRKQVTIAVVHEDDSEGEGVELRNAQGRQGKSKTNRVLSLTESTKSSFAAQDTYI
ncbi:uncharacterized protein LOC107043810 [Diachasma alloeum]|uniref:uncharacterized protein LOC107043810 n=1 Tax=Diachasma alloeum TaxID=454923 RepID=UPI000738464A|nr:uncharacterized protein LOC107043810 [Diachasma alloeum]